MPNYILKTRFSFIFRYIPASPVRPTGRVAGTSSSRRATLAESRSAPAAAPGAPPVAGQVHPADLLPQTALPGGGQPGGRLLAGGQQGQAGVQQGFSPLVLGQAIPTHLQTAAGDPQGGPLVGGREE